MDVDGHYERSGAVYAFSLLRGQGVLARIRAAIEQFDQLPRELPGFLSFAIRREWLEQFCTPLPMPSFMDMYSKAPILLITGHYRVKDWPALTQALSTQSDIDGDSESGWCRVIDCEDGQCRPIATINIETRADRITVFYKTQDYADQGRPWFAALAGHAVQFVSRELSDPAALLRNQPAGQAAKPVEGGLDFSPEALAEMIEETVRRTYANWADEPIPALADKTPRQAIKTAAGLQRVKGLLRSYEANEKKLALGQGRREISFDFLWRTLGISR